MIIDSLDSLLDALADRIADRMASREQSLISQRDRRGLGGRRHIAAVKRRLAEKRGGAYVYGRDYLLTPAALREELERCGTAPGNDNDAPRPAAGPRVKKTKAAERDELAALRRELETELATARQRT